MNIEIRVKEPETKAVSFKTLNVGQLVTDKTGWTRIKINHSQYLCMKDDEIQVHQGHMFCPGIPVSPAKDVKIIIEEIE